MKNLIAVTVLTAQVNAALGFVEWWKMAWCDFGMMYNFKDFACGTNPPELSAMIPAGQRTNNIAGWSLDARMWAQPVSTYSSNMVYV